MPPAVEKNTVPAVKNAWSIGGYNALWNGIFVPLPSRRSVLYRFPYCGLSVKKVGMIGSKKSVDRESDDV
jgi:hypothetical protein